MKKIYILMITVIIGMTSCTKDYLDKKPDKALLVPTTLNDFQKLLDNTFFGSLNVLPGVNEIASDNFVSDDASLQALSATERNSYLWNKDIYEGSSDDDWNMPYQAIFNTNVVLDGLAKIQVNSSNQDAYNKIKGTALYYRSLAFYSLAQLFTEPYDKKAAASFPGIPIRLTSDVNKIAGRGTLQQTYDQIISDLNTAATLLPVSVQYKNRPTKAAAYAILARVFQTTEDYANALTNATSALNLNKTLIDYNSLQPTGQDSPFPLTLPYGNDEVLCYETLVGYSFYIDPGTLVSPDLYPSYADNDLRKACFFADQGGGIVNYIGTYTGDFSSFFGGPAVDELYLIRAECYARDGNTNLALTDLNTLLKTRWKTGAFTPFTATSSDDALKLILKERRKELIGRGLRWTDLRRLNKDSRFAITLTRIYNGKTISLPPGSKLYTFPIPDDEVRRSGIQQNNR